MYEDCVLQSMRFPQKLWRIVNECQSGAIQWGTNGDTILLDYKKFQTEYLDTRRPIFKTSNITSFIRQLNLYGFRKVTSHGRDPICNNPYVHEFLHDNFRSDRMDLLSKVCRKTGGKSKNNLQHSVMKSLEENNSRLKTTSCVSRLKLCQLALTKTLEEITQEYRRGHEEKLIIAKNNNLKMIRGPQDTDSCAIGFSDAENRGLIVEHNVKHSVFLPANTISPSARKKVSSSWLTTTTDKYSLHLGIQDHH